MSQPDLGTAIQMSGPSIQRFESGGKLDPLKRHEILRRIAKACDLPVEFFVADFRRLPEIASGLDAEEPGDIPGFELPGQDRPQDAPARDEPANGEAN